MPTVPRKDGYRFYFYSNEPDEPPHIHVDKAGASAKLWLHPIAVARNLGFNGRELSDLMIRTRKHQDRFLEAWHGHFPKSR